MSNILRRGSANVPVIGSSTLALPRICHTAGSDKGQCGNSASRRRVRLDVMRTVVGFLSNWDIEEQAAWTQGNAMLSLHLAD